MFYLYKIGKVLYNCLPASLCYIIAKWIGNIIFFIGKNERIKVEDDLRHIKCLSLDKKRSKFTARRIYQNFNICLVDFLRTSKINRDNISQIIEFENIENLDDALAENKGVILLSAHFGNWELGGIALSVLGYPMNVVYMPHSDKRLDNLFIQQRVSKGERIFALGVDTKKIFSVFENKEILAIVGDIRIGNSDTGIKVNFLGKETIFPRGPAALSIKTGAIIVPGFTVMTSCGKYKVILEKSIVPQQNQSNDIVVKLCTQEFASILENYVKKYPEQWFVFGNM